jgi:glycosyltransferase involved in cell wall biosynthesis
MKSLRIGISARGLNSPASGPREYIEGFVSAFVGQAAPHQVHLYYNTEKFLGMNPLAIERVLPNAHYLLWDQILLPYAFHRDDIDLAILPKGTIPFIRPCRAMPIILDMGYFYPELNAYKTINTLYMRAAMRFAAKSAWGIFTISQHTRDDVVKLLDIPQERLKNIYGGVNDHYMPIADPTALEGACARYGLELPFIFYPTTISPRKNIDRVLDAFEQIQQQIPHHLYLTGNITWKSSATEERLRGPISNRVHRLGLVAKEDMPAIYSLAEFTIYPSLLEGLGLPVLEAFKCGSPVLVSNQSCLPEITAAAAHIVDGYDVASIASGILKMARDGGLRSTLRQRGFERVRTFTWENTARTAIDWINARWD